MLAPNLGRTARQKALPRLSCSLSNSPSSQIGTRVPQSISHQRRNSSSKPSSSSNGDSSHVSTPENAAVVKDSTSEESGAKEHAPASRKRTFTKLGRNKPKESSAKTMVSPQNSYEVGLPSVPSTQHLHKQVDIHIASLFAFHRPISVERPLPKSITEKEFSQIFSSPPAPKYQPVEVAFTLSSAIQTLEKGAQQAAQQQKQLNPSEQSLRNAVTQASQSNLKPNSPEAQKLVYINLEELAKNFRPFHPPPPPVPAEQMEEITQASTPAQALQAQDMDLPAAVVEEIFEDNPSRSVPKQPFLNRLLIRYRRREDMLRERRKEIMHAISVKRQRRLKMKKHKYKKLMRRTRNLRQRQGRL